MSDDKYYISASEIYMGLSHSDLCASWFNWLVGLDPDGNNTGPVFYLRGMDFAQDPSQYHYTFVRVGSDKLKISEGKAVFWPIIFYYVSQFHYPYLDEQGMFRLLTKWMDYGDNPPRNYQATLDGEPIALDFSGERVISPVFELTVPDAAYGKTLATQLDEPFSVPGRYKCVAGGYFVLIKGLGARRQPYTIVSHGEGEMQYATDTLAQIQVRAMDLKAMRPASENEVVANDLKEIVKPSVPDETKRNKINYLIDISHGLKDPKQIVIE
jgi:hypothetical protein